MPPRSRAVGGMRRRRRGGVMNAGGVAAAARVLREEREAPAGFGVARGRDRTPPRPALRDAAELQPQQGGVGHSARGGEKGWAAGGP
eukprot:gene15008-biopygen5390